VWGFEKSGKMSNKGNSDYSNAPPHPGRGGGNVYHGESPSFGGSATEQRIREYERQPTYEPSNYKKHPGAKGKHQNTRVDKFMKKKGTEVMQSYQADVKTRLFGGFTGFEESLTKVGDYSSPVDVVLPVSTRVVGFATQRFRDEVENIPDLRRKTNEIPSAQKLYRVLLAAVDERLRTNAMTANILHDVWQLCPVGHALHDFLAATKVLTAVPINIGVMIESIGKFSMNGKSYVPLIPKIYQIGEHDAPSPEYVSFQNLQHTVTKLSQVVINDFRRFNPLPGAEWNEAGLLVNPEAFWPPNYNLTAFNRDVLEVKRFLALVSSERPKLTGYLKLEGRGSVAVLMSSSYNEMSLVGNQITGDIQSYYCSEILTAADRSIGTYIIVGERPHGRPDSGLWSLRAEEYVYEYEYLMLLISFMIMNC
jgi:hypothetical protein